MKTIHLLLLVLVLTACGSHSRQSSQEQKPRQTTFVFPEIPEMLTEPEQRLSFLIQHYWEEFDFADTTLLAQPDIAEQGFVNFIALFPQAVPEDLTAGLDSLVRRAEPHPAAFTYLLAQAEKYLYDPNSPFHNEEFYVQFVRPFVGSKAIGYADKSRLEFRMKLASMNRVGTPATDFKFIIYPKENASSLRATAGKELLLVFYDPECEGCHETLMELMKSDVLAQRVVKGDVSVLAVYTEGNLEVWRKTAPGLPETWTIAADTSCLVKDTPLYDLKAMPTLYLLDTQKNVVLKDTSIPALMSYWTEGA